MAIRNIVKEGDPILSKVCRPVEKFDEKLGILLDDMYETMLDGDDKLEFVNPKITATRGEQEGSEGCLSCPGEFGITIRPMYVTVEAQNRFGDQFILNAEGLLAKAICHENDHLDGILFKEHVIRKATVEEMSE